MSYQPHLKLPTEFALAVACCRWSYSGEDADLVRTLVKRVDWARFLGSCRRHRVQGLAWHALSGLNIPVPAGVRIAFSGDARAIANQGLHAAKESARLNDAFRAAGLPLLFLKGLTVGKLAYGNPFLKMGWDIDLLVRPADVVRAASLLASLGYAPDRPRNADRLARWHAFHNQSLWHLGDSVFVELHSRVTELPFLVPTLTATSPSQIVGIAPGIDLPTLADGEMLAYLCVHGGWSAWFRLKWIADFAALLHGRDDEDIYAIYERSQELGAARSAAQALLLAAMLFDIPLGKLTPRLKSPVNRWLARTAVRRLLGGEPTAGRLGTLPIHVSHFFLKDGASYKMAELRRKLGNAARLS